MSRVKKNIVLETSNLCIGYSKKRKQHLVAKNINLSLEQGALVGLIGANGAGKSTLIKTLTGDLNPISGLVTINNENLQKLSERALAQKLSIVLASNVPSSNLNVKELIALGRQPYTNWLGSLSTNDEEKVAEALKLIQIEDLADKKCFELSDGQFQKVMLARALAQDTEIVILDEPTTHLDLYHKVYILKLLQRLTEETGKTIVFATHEINMALSLCDQMIVMKETETLVGTASELVEQKAFNDLFPEDLVMFDTNTGNYRIT